jgi:hypothetical protein
MSDLMSKILEIPKLALLFGGSLAIAISGAEQLPFTESKVPLYATQKNILLFVGIASVAMGLWWCFSEIRGINKSTDEKQKISTLTGKLEQTNTINANLISERDNYKKANDDVRNALSSILPKTTGQTQVEIFQLIAQLGSSPSSPQGDFSLDESVYFKRCSDWLKSQIPNERCPLILNLDENQYTNLVDSNKMNDFRIEIYQHIELLGRNLMERRSGRFPRGADIQQKAASNEIAYKKALLNIKDSLILNMEKSSEMEGRPSEIFKYYLDIFVERVDWQKKE